MPVFDWTRTELARMRPDGSTVLAYTQEAVDAINPEKMFESISGETNGAVMPGWEPERMAHVKELFELYKGIDEDKLFETKISRNVKLTEAPGFGKPAFYHDRNSKGAKEYVEVAKELVTRI